MNPQELFDKYPVLKQILDFFEQYGGLLLVIAFAVLMIYIFYWIIVIAPRRVRQVFAELSAKGYSTIDPDSQEISQIVTQLAPIYPIGPRKDQEIPEWKKNLAVKLHSANNVTRYVVNVSRSQIDKLGRMNSTLRKTNIILEKRKLQFSESVYIYPVKNHCSVLWEWRYKLKKITSGLDNEFLEKYHAYSKSGEIQDFPSSFRAVLMNSCAVLCDTSFYCFQGGVTLKFQKEGWGLCPANEIYKFKDMKMLIEIADAISRALP
ncbi:MAG: hypothetical protein JRI53_10195 [Deltaproteobacteria bacterium]|nr:hypothetical protein [Deltaproteobacteria bacterium]